MFGDTNQRTRTTARFIVFATACWQQRTFCAGAHAVGYTFARESLGAFSVPCKALTRDSRLGQRPWHARQRYSEIVTLRFCRVMRAAQPRAARTAAATAHLPKRSAAKNQN